MNKKHKAQHFAERLISILGEKKRQARERRGLIVCFAVVAVFLVGYRIKTLYF
jgi:beta-lactamase regulating signal transducer with metallopeptidase domain